MGVGRTDGQEARVLSVRELPADERPREKLLTRGPDALTNAELVALILNTGSQGESVLTLAQRILSESGGGLRGLARRDLDALMSIRGLGPAKAVKLAAALEIGRRLGALTPDERPVVKTPEDLALIFQPGLTMLDHEQLRVAVLDTKHRLERIVTVYRGSVSSAQVRTAEVFREAVRANCPAVAIAHNHPSGDPTPSADDIALTAHLVNAARTLDIELLDHLIIGDGRWVSLRRSKLGFT